MLSDKPVDLVQTMLKKTKVSPKEQALQDYFKSLYAVGEAIK
jgi:hypothetical protein